MYIAGITENQDGKENMQRGNGHGGYVGSCRDGFQYSSPVKGLGFRVKRC